MSAEKKKSDYTGQQIQVLHGLEAVRVRPGMYIGSTGSQGLHHLVYEIVDNSVDEALAGFCKHIELSINEDNSITVCDDGRGMPVDMHPTEHKPTVEVIHTQLHAGGKFGGGGYKVSGGLHGVGASVVNALSTHMIVEVKRGGKLYEQEYFQGKRATELKVLGEAEGSGSKTTFWPDPEIFDETIYDYDILQNRMREMAFLNKGLRITIEDKREGRKKKESFCYEGGIREFVTFMNRNKKVINEDVFYFENHKKDEATGKEYEVEVALQYTGNYNETVMSYANNINTIEGGFHLQGLKAAITRTLNDYARRTKQLKEKDDSLTGDDCREGVTAIVSVKLTERQFEGQTKAKLGNSEVRGFVESSMNEYFNFYLEEHPAQAKKIVTKSINAANAREAARKARETSRKTNVLESTSLPGKLKDCSEKDPEICEIFLVEGDSAGGSAQEGRDRARQAVLPLRGKILNVEKLDSQEIRNMITAFGCGIDDNFDISKLRYHKIIIMTDADVDGAHIRTLLLTFFYRFMRPLIEEGYVYAAQPPLFRVKRGKETWYTYSDKEQEDLLAELREKDSKTKVEIQRYKGLGEMDYTQLWETTMDYNHRTLIRISLDDAEKADEMITTLMGDKVPPRKKFIEENARYATLDL